MKQKLTRTIWVSCLSHFLLLLLHKRQICNVFFTLIGSSARNLNLVPGLITAFEIDCTPSLCQWLQTTLYPGKNSRLRSNLYRDTRNVQQNLYHDGKKCAIPSLHRNNFPTKEPGYCPDATSGNTTSPYRRAVMVNLCLE